jgi:exosortase
MIAKLFSSVAGDRRPGPLLAVLGVVIGLLWAYWPTLGGMARRWASDPQYSHGYLVPLFAVGLLWVRRERLATVAFAPSWWGVALITAGLGLWLAGARLYFPWLEAVALLPCVLGVFALLGGAAALRWAWPAVAFLLFMVPLPYRLGTAMAPSLQRFATLASTYVLETLGFPAVAEGNIILLNDARIGVVEACGGLSMLIIFFALSTAVAILIRRAWWEKGILVLSAVPIALVANVTRIVATGVLAELVSATAADIFHEWAAWWMMPLALALVALELRLLSRLLVERKTARTMPMPRWMPTRLLAVQPKKTKQAPPRRPAAQPTMRGR